MEKFAFAAVITAVAGIISYTIDVSTTADADSKTSTTATASDVRANAR